MALDDSIRAYQQRERDIADSKEYGAKLNIAESIMYRHELLKRLKEASEELFPLPF